MIGAEQLLNQMKAARQLTADIIGIAASSCNLQTVDLCEA